MKEYSLNNFEKKRFRIKGAIKRSISLLLALIMMFPAGTFASANDEIWNEYKKTLKTYLLNQNKDFYEIPYKGSQADSSYFAETKAKELFNDVMKEIPVKNGDLNIEGKVILPVWEGQTLKSIRHRITYYNSKADLDKIDKVLEDIFLDIVGKNDTDIERVNAAIDYVKKDGKLGFIGVKNDVNKIYADDGSMNTEVSNRVYGIIFSILMDKLGYKNSVNLKLDDEVTNKVTVLGKEHFVNVAAGNTIIVTNPTKAQIEYEISLALKEVNASVSIGGLEELAKAVITSNKLKEIKDKIVEIEKEISRYEDKYNVLENTAEKANLIVIIEGIVTEGELKAKFEELQTAIDGLKDKLNGKKGQDDKITGGQKLEIVKKIVTNAEANPTTVNLAIAKEAVEILNDTHYSKTYLIARIDIVEKIIASTDAVKKAEITKKETDINVAKEKIVEIKKISNSDKDPLKTIIKNLEDAIELLETSIKENSDQQSVTEATKAVEAAEAGVNRYLNGQISTEDMQTLIDASFTKIEKVATDQEGVTTKSDLTKRLNEVVTKKGNIDKVTKAVEDMEALFNEDDIDKILAIIDKDDAKYEDTTKRYLNAIEEGKTNNAIGTALNTRIVEIQKVLVGIESVDGMEREADIKTARAAVKKIGTKFEKIKNALNEEIGVREEGIIADEPAMLMEAAKAAIQEAYKLLVVPDKDDTNIDKDYSSTKVTAAVKTAKTAIGKIKDPLEKIKANRAIEGIESTQKARDAVALVEVTELRKDYTNADKLVTAITDRKEFDGYIVGLDSGFGQNGNFIKIKDTLIERLKEVLPKIETEEAKVAVTKAENSLTQKDVDTAKEAVGKNGVKDSDKVILESRIDKVQYVIDITEKVISAEKNPEALVKQDDIKGITNIEDDITIIINTIKGNIATDINKIPETITSMLNRKSDLINRLQSLEKVWEGIVAVRNAEYIQSQIENSEVMVDGLTVAIDFANIKIPNVGNAKVKRDLENRILAIVNQLAANDFYKEANDKVTLIEGDLKGILVISLPSDGPIKDHSNFDNNIKTLETSIIEADNLIKLVKDRAKSTTLKNRLTDVTNAKDAAKLIVIAEKSKPYVQKEITATEKAIVKMVDTGDYKEIKENFLARVNFLNIEVKKQAAYENAKNLVEKATISLREADIIKAIDAVFALEFEPHKKERNEKINEIINRLKEQTDTDILSAITSIELNDKTISKNVIAAEKSVILFKNIVVQAKKLPSPENDGKSYEDIYKTHITTFENNIKAIKMVVSVDASIKQADKSKTREDLEKTRLALENLKTATAEAEVGGKYIEKYKGIVASLEKRIDSINDYLEDEKTNQDEAIKSIKEADKALRADDESVAGDVYKKEELRGKLTERISHAQVKVNNIKDKTVQKTLQSDLNKIIVGRDAIVAVNRAKENITGANVKAAIAAVKKISPDFGKVIVELEKEIGELERILSMLEEAGKVAKLVEIAESTKKQNDYDKAKTAVDLLVEGNPKRLLLDRLEKVLDYIKNEDLKDKTAIEKAEEALNKALVNITQANIVKVNPSEEETRRAYLLLEGKEEIQNGTLVVITDGAEHFLKKAKDEVKKITLDLARKNMLNEIIIQREAQIVLAKEKVHIKEAARLVDIAATSASKLVNLPENATAEEREEAELAARRDAEAARLVIGRINSPENIIAKLELQNSLERIEGILTAKDAAEIVALATSAVEEAFKYVSIAATSRENNVPSLREDIEKAEMKIRAANRQIAIIPDIRAKDRKDLTESINAATNRLQNIIDGISDEDTIARAMVAIEEARKRVESKDPDAAYYITAARIIVNSIINDSKRAELTAILDALLAALDDGSGVIDDGKNDKDKLAAAVKAVEKAEASRLQKDVDAARKLVNALVDGPTKESLNKRLDAIKVIGINKPGDNDPNKKPGGSGSGGKGNGIKEDPRPIDERDKNNQDVKWGKENGFKKK